MKIRELTLKCEPGFLISWSRLFHFVKVQIQKAAHVTLFVRFQTLLDDGFDEAVYTEASLSDCPIAGSVGEEVPHPGQQAVDGSVVIAIPLEHHGVLSGSGRIDSN